MLNENRNIGYKRKRIEFCYILAGIPATLSRRYISNRSSHSQMFFKIGALKNFANFTGKRRVLESLFYEIAGLTL